MILPRGDDNAYLPLDRVALDSDDASRGTDAAIKVLALRRHAVEWTMRPHYECSRPVSQYRM
jgi:hypothetical protein